MTSTKDSIIEHLQPLTTTIKQRFVSDFTGNDDTFRDIFTYHWETHGSGGTWAMDDNIDGGFKITSGTSAEAMIDISTANTTAGLMRPFNRQGCVMITVCKLTQAQYAIMNAAHLTDAWYTEASSYVKSLVQGVTNGNSGDSKFRLTSGEFTNIDTDQTGVYDWHTHKLECKTSTTELSIDGILKATGAGVPDNHVMPRFASAPSEGTVNAVANIRYMEVYNT